jgi:hypothetical protein
MDHVAVSDYREKTAGGCTRGYSFEPCQPIHQDRSLGDRRPRTTQYRGECDYKAWLQLHLETFAAGRLLGQAGWQPALADPYWGATLRATCGCVPEVVECWKLRCFLRLATTIPPRFSPWRAQGAVHASQGGGSTCSTTRAFRCTCFQCPQTGFNLTLTDEALGGANAYRDRSVRRQLLFPLNDN